MARAFMLYKNGLRYFQDIWDHCRNGFLRWEDAQFKFSLVEVHFDFLIKLVEHHGLFPKRLHSQHGAKPTLHE